MRTLIAGGTVITAADTARADVLVVDGQIEAVGRRLGARADLTIDAAGRYVIPGGVDAHTHMELPTSGTVACDDFATGTAAAAWGGTTTIIDYAGHDRGEPLLAGLARWQARAAGRAHVDYGFHMMISEVDDRVLAELAELVSAGVTSVKVFTAYPGVYMVDDAAIFRMLRRAGQLGVLTAVHAENGGPIEVLRAEFVASGRTGAANHALSRPAILEGEATARVIVLAELAGAPVYIAHLSAAEALDAVHRARDRGRPVYAETCPQYLYLDESALSGPEPARYVCSPPLRPASTHEALWHGIRRGDLDVVATDHCPFTTGQKALGQDDFTRIPNGLHGVEERLSLLHEGVYRGEISLNRWVDVAATAPARLFGLYPRKGAIVPGADADLVVFDPRAVRTLSAATHHSAVDYSVYEGSTVHGRPELVMRRGEVLLDADGFRGRPGAGQFLRRGLPQL
ncbi:MAG TPA: dihydropyrimidinase [Streptosporangiaceae bacterium]|nr:dihydropyrimidinase [Streptosporangiaceae bacterium]